MENKKLNKLSIIITILIIVLIFIIAFLLIKRVGYVNEADAKFIGNNSVLYVQLGCFHCEKQKAIFGDNYKYLTIVDCFEEENRQRCVDEGIDATPTWVIKGEKYIGFKTLEELKRIFINNE